MKLIVKLSGKVVEENDLTHRLASQICELRQAGHSLLIVHGGGKQLTEFCRQAGIGVVQVQGRRVTDEATLEAAKKVFSAINRDLTAVLTSLEVPAVGIAAFDGNLTRCHKRPPLLLKTEDGKAEAVDFGLVGEIDSVDPTLVELLWSRGFVPVVSSLCADDSGQVLNINADTLAAELALALGADRVVSVSDVDGIYLNPVDPGTRIGQMTLETARAYLEGGVFLDGMIPKVQNALRALDRGVAGFQVISGLQEGALRNFLSPDQGTLISRQC